MYNYPFFDIRSFEGASLPFYRSVKLFLLFGGTQPQVNRRGIQAFVTENIRQERDVLVFFQKKYGKQMPESMRMQHLFADFVLQSVFLDKAADSPRCDLLAETIRKQIV